MTSRGIATKLNWGIDLAWAAGFFEGEGSLFIQKWRGKTGLSYRLASVGNTDPTALTEFIKLFGGKIHTRERKPPRKKMYEWVTTGHGCHRFVKTLLPYLRSNSKTEQAKIILEGCEPPKQGFTDGLSEFDLSCI